jgi:hypothetical protein
LTTSLPITPPAPRMVIIMGCAHLCRSVGLLLVAVKTLTLIGDFVFTTQQPACSPRRRARNRSGTEKSF